MNCSYIDLWNEFETFTPEEQERFIEMMSVINSLQYEAELDKYCNEWEGRI